jgi:hypothetical protein
MILMVLSMPNNELRDETALAILRALSTNTTINTLDIGWNDFGCQVYVQLTRMIEQHQRQLSLNVEEMAMRHISWLKQEERRLFQFRADIREKVQEIGFVTAHRTEKAESLASYKREKLEEVQRAEAENEQLDGAMSGVGDTRKVKLAEYHELRQELEERQGKALGEYQGFATRRQSMVMINAKKTAAVAELERETAREVAALRKRIDDAREQLTSAVRDVLQAKAAILESEAMEALRQQEAAAAPKTAKGGRAKGKNSPKRKKGKQPTEPEGSPSEQAPQPVTEKGT